jgi:hypothetical protein
MESWRNALRILADKQKRYLHTTARKTLNAISDEWLRRSKETIDPDERFPWPSTEADLGSGGLSTDDWLTVGMLGLTGYRVGRTNGIATPVRQVLLSEVFISHLPPAFPATYMTEWGAPKTARRLQKMAESIAAYTRNAKRKRAADMGDAIRDWESDLKFLYDMYYVEHFHFAWPLSKLP